MHLNPELINEFKKCIVCPIHESMNATSEIFLGPRVPRPLASPSPPRSLAPRSPASRGPLHTTSPHVVKLQKNVGLEVTW